MQAIMSSATAFRDQANRVFAEGIAPGPGPTGSAALKGLARSIPIYYWPDDVTDVFRRSVLMALTLSGRSQSVDMAEWETFVLTWSALAFPELLPALQTANNGEYQFKPLPQEFLDDVAHADQEITTTASATPAIRLPDDLPQNSDPYTVGLYNCGTVHGIYGYYALIVYLMGKRVTPATRENITVRRPKNIVDKFSLTAETYILTGAGRMSDTAHKMVTPAWSQVSPMRRVMVNGFCDSLGSGTAATETVAVMWKLLEYSGMQPAALIHKLISVCPWIAEEVPLVKPAYDWYVQSVIAYAREDPRRRPYFKLMYGDSNKLFHSKTLADLTACAVRLLQVTQPSVADYTAPGSARVVDQFVAAAERRGVPMTSHTVAVLTTPATTE